MPRPNKIWYRKDTGWWMVTMAGKKIRLAAGRKNRQDAEKKFHELMLTRHQAPDAPEARVVDIVEAFLAFSEKRYTEDTFRNYRFYCQKFAEACGQRLVTDLKPFHVTKWIDGMPWNETTERNGRRVAHRARSWAKEEGLITANPLQGIKCPRPQTRKRALSEAEFRTMIRASGPLFNSTGVFQGKKGTLQEGGLRTPMIVRWPHKVPSGRVSETPWYFPDVLPTLAELAGARPPQHLYGISIRQTLMGQPQDLSQRYMYWEKPPGKFQQAARHGNWKALRLDRNQPMKIFDIVADPTESFDVAAAHPDLVAKFETYFSTARTESAHWPNSLVDAKKEQK